MIEHTISPVLFELFGLEIRYYGIIWALGLIFTYLYLMYVVAKKKEIPNFTEKDVENFIIGMIICTIIGARLFHVFIYNFDFYFTNPNEILKIWRGGLSFHGGMFFAILWTWFFSKKRKIHFLRITDALVIPVALVLSLGRIANFINGELRGVITNLPIGIKYSDEEFARLPTQIFESLKNFLIFLMLIIAKILKTKLFKRYAPGLLSAIFLIVYGTLRFFIEFFKESTNILFSLNIAQILSILTIITGVIIYYYLGKKIKTEVAKVLKK